MSDAATPPPAAAPAISVIVPSYNSSATIGAVLEALLAQRAGLREIVVADSSDDPAALAQLAAFEPRGVTVLRLPARTPPARARNAGAGRASGDWLAFVDADAPPAADWAARLRETIAGGARVGGGALRLPAGQRLAAIAWAQYFLQFNEFTPASRAGVVRFTPSANLFCERALFEKVGGFPDLRAAEDVTFGIKAGALAPFRFAPDLIVDHLFRTAPAAVAANQRLLGEYVYRWRAAADPGFALRGARAKWLWPLVIAAKGARIQWRVLMTGRPGYWLGFLYGSFWFAFGLWHWGRGFASGAGGEGGDG